MNDLITTGAKDKITSLELVKQINIFRKEEDKDRADLQHSDLLKIIRDEFESEIAEGKISCGSYKDKQNQERPMFELTLSQAKQVLMRESKFVRKKMIEYIEKLEQAISYESQLKLGLFSDDPLVVVQSHKALVELATKPLKKEIEYKEDIIVGLTDNIDLMDMRQILNTVVRYKGANYRERWSLLYFEFEKKYHIDINRRLETYNSEHKPKMKNKLEYIDKVMNKLPQLYNIACKLFEGDIDQIIENYKKVIQ